MSETDLVGSALKPDSWRHRHGQVPSQSRRARDRTPLSRGGAP